MRSPVARSLYSRDGLRRVDIFQRPDGTFGFEELRFDAALDAWVPFGRYSTAFVDTAERALAEARGRIGWLAAESATGSEPPV